jgi:hypothetical protein
MEENNNEKNVRLIGKVARMPKNTKAKSAYTFLENIKVSKSKLWYILIEKDENELQCIKYNNKMGVNLKKFVEQLKEYHKNDPELYKYIEKLTIEGNDRFSILKNISDVEVKNGKKMITFLTEELIQLLYK